MNINIYNQLFNLAMFIITGIITGILFDIFRILRRSFKTNDIVTYIEDILFWILAGFIILSSIFIFNNGEIRIYIFVGLIFGLSIYLLTFSKYFIKLSVNIITFLKKIVYFPIHYIYIFIKKYIIRPFSAIINKIKRFIKRQNFPKSYNKVSK